MSAKDKERYAIICTEYKQDWTTSRMVIIGYRKGGNPIAQYPGWKVIASGYHHIRQMINDYGMIPGGIK